MKKVLFSMMAIMMLLVVPIAFVGCGNSVVGDWKFSSVEVEGQEMTAEEKAFVELMYSNVVVTFNKDNTGTYAMSYTIMGETYSDTQEFTWSQKGKTVTITKDGESTDLTISGGKITFTETENGVTYKMIFEKKK